MTQEIATVVASMLQSDDLFSVDDSGVWLPDLDSYSFSMQEHIARALELHGYSASTSTRSHAGLRIDVAEAQSIDSRQLKAIHTDAYGYTGRVAGLDAQGQTFVDHITEPGSVLQIPDLGWVNGSERVVVGEYSGLYLAEVHTDSAETYGNDDTFQVEVGHDREQEMTLHEMGNQGRVIVYKGEWNGYPQERF
ncbi:hypothetical protein [Halorubellus salinus]|uniref:hypothetical protein n=1 Tax=Halorubellus salinus TaxID=755309 RepID=UPI001D06CE0C|nr:hypothetical protein [Halorubellus salinus]